MNDLSLEKSRSFQEFLWDILSNDSRKPFAITTASDFSQTFKPVENVVLFTLIPSILNYKNGW